MRSKKGADLKVIKLDIKNLRGNTSLEPTGETYEDLDTGENESVMDRPNRFYKELQELEDRKKNLLNYDKLYADITFLRDVMRTYIKIEWSKAK